ncbi:hypothetical protein V6N13_062445 [Hibiscus sabdariffa]
MGSIAERTFERCSSNTVNSNGKGISLICFRNDLRCMLIKKPAPRSYKLKDWWHESVGAKCAIRDCIKLAKSLGPPPSIDDWGIIPSIEQLGLQSEKAS